MNADLNAVLVVSNDKEREAGLNTDKAKQRKRQFLRTPSTDSAIGVDFRITPTIFFPCQLIMPNSVAVNPREDA